MEVGVDVSRRVEVKPRPGPKRKVQGGLSPAAVLIKQRIAEVACRLALGGTWPSPKSVGDADEGLTKDNVAHHRDALEAARLKWVELYGPHSHWKALKPVVDGGTAVAARVVDATAASAAEPDDGHGATIIVRTMTDAEIATPEPASAGASSAAGHPLVCISELEARIDDLDARVVALDPLRGSKSLKSPLCPDLRYPRLFAIYRLM